MSLLDKLASIKPEISDMYQHFNERKDGILPGFLLKNALMTEYDNIFVKGQHIARATIVEIPREAYTGFALSTAIEDIYNGRTENAIAILGITILFYSAFSVIGIATSGNYTNRRIDDTQVPDNP
ncbi:MAG: hypothetical protein AABX51_06625 [Nanoarchaeota archaeon]